VRRLAGSSGASLIVLVAPAGYGKTTLLHQWEIADPRPFERMTIEEAEREPARLTAHFAEPRIPSVLVLDDAHLLRSPAALRALRAAARLADAESPLVLASRAEPEVPIGRLRTEAAVVELRAGDLSMTEREASQLLRRAGLSLGPADVAALVRRTEGWPAGLCLAALSLSEQHDAAGAIARFGGDDRFVADYLRDELIADLSTEDAAFVTNTSLLDELTGPLCDAVLEQSGSGRVLRDLARSNLLLASLDHAEERFRYHGLLADMLRAELRRAEPDRALEVHRRASAWHEQEGDTARAVEHAISAGDLDRAGELMWSVISACAGSAGAATIDRWMASLRGRQIASRPALALSAAAASILRGERDAAARWTSAGERSLDRAGRELRPSLAAGAAVMRAMIVRDGLAEMAADAVRAYDLVADDSPWRSMACLLAGAAHHLMGDRERARAELEEGAMRGALTAPVVRATCLAQLALLALEDEDLEQGADLSLRARDLAERADVTGLRGCTLVFAVSALAAAHRGDVERAREDVVQARRRLGRVADLWPWYDAEVRIALARAELRLSNAASARTLLAEASRALRWAPDATVLQAWIDDAWNRADTFAVGAVAGPTTLTTAELRVLRFLPSHLSFRELATRLHVSANTVKTQAHAVYRKLDASSRSEAVARARHLGLIDGSS
jgi:LuxR family maltose regulon positive regulatory protein